VLAIVSSLLALAAVLIAAPSLHGLAPTPALSSAALERYAAHPTADRISGFLSFGSAIPLAIFAATAYARLHMLGVRAPGAAIALAGGVLSAGFLALAGICTWMLSRPEVASTLPLTRVFIDLGFAVGGPVHVTLLGLLVAGLAVPGLIIGLLPQRLAAAGLAVAVLCELSSLSLDTTALDVLLPIGRITALVWLIAAGFILPASRHPAVTAPARSMPD
jgi:hypothetical protein